MSKDQKDAGEFLLRKLSKVNDNDQLLMFLHGSPGTGKSFLLKRLKNFTNVLMRITATSGIAAMSLNGSTIDYLLDKRYVDGTNKQSNNLGSRTEKIEKRLGKSTLIILDEVSMLSCAKFVEMDSLLRKVKKSDLPFGGLDVLLVGDFAQLPPVMATSIITALVQCTHEFIVPEKDILLASELASRFLKFDLKTLIRSKGCTKLKELLQKYRSIDNTEPSLTMEQIQEIGIIDRKTLKKDKLFKEATILVSTRRERDKLTESLAQIWAKRSGIPLYW